MDSEKEELNQADIAALHHFYSKHISDLPDDQALTELFAQVKSENILIRNINKISKMKLMVHFGHCVTPVIPLWGLNGIGSDSKINI